MDSTIRPRCDVCYDLNEKAARLAVYGPEGIDGPYGNDQAIKKSVVEGLLFIHVNRDLVRAKASKCVFCALITHVDSSPGPGTHLLRLYADRPPVIDMDSARQRRRFEVYRLTDLTPEPETTSTMLEVSEIPSIQYIPTRPEISNEPLSERAFTFIKRCLETCIQEHSVCKQRPSRPPKRLIYIQDPESSSVKVIKTSLNFNEPYVALSYCWGQGVCLKATKSNIQDMMAGISRANLPSVISDAIQITATLGFRYIWVDSLCIIQDDAQDWDEESSRMCAIYEGAYITIAASSSESADVPLTERHRRHEPIIFEYRQNTSSTSRNHPAPPIARLAAREECSYGFHNEDSARRPDREPLHDRGWTLQEAILSTRVVFFTPTELQWQCQAQQTCECLIPPPIKPDAITTRAHIWERSVGQTGPAPREREIYAAWDRIVERYTERLLTNPDDKLPALSGLAQLVQRSISMPERVENLEVGAEDGNRMQTERKLEYVAGLWTGDLIRGMLWGPRNMTVQLPSSPVRGTTPTTGLISTNNGLDDCSVKPEETSYYRAPSFSWASVDGPVSYRSRNSDLSLEDEAYVETARVVDFWSLPAGVDPYGRLTATTGNPQSRRGSRTGVVLRAPVIEDCAIIWNTSRNMHNSPWTLREIEPLWDTLWLDTSVVERFAVGDASIPRTGQNECEGKLKGVMPQWSVRRWHRERADIDREVEKGVVMGGVSLLMMVQSSQVQRFLLLGISPSDGTAYERLGTVSISRVSGGGDLVRLSKEILSHSDSVELEGIEWTGKGGVVSRMRTVTII
ncbi:heterokaryon incompatibility protein-domain-containing protein [Nemania sp. FL0916]|nr:heterokaryon incompatibility protein-domain-containing protein [Nemania sp. FL0916]